MTKFQSGLKKMQLNKLLLLLFFEITAVIAFFHSLFNRDIAAGFSFVCMLPLSFGLFSFLLMIADNDKEKIGRITVYIFLAVQWLRLVLLPLLGSISGYFSTYGMNVTESTANSAILLLLYETFATFLFTGIVISFLKKKREPSLSNTTLAGNRYIYVLFILFAAAVFVLSGADSIYFFMMDLSEERLSETAEESNAILNSIVFFGLTFLVVLVLYYCYRKFKATGKKRYVYAALLCSVLRLCFILSEGRMAQVYLFGVFILLLPQLFPKYKKKIMKTVIVAAVAVLAVLTIYKNFHAFLYDSYIDALQSSSFDLADTATQIDVYFYGVKTVARNVDFCRNASVSLLQPIYDFFRNTFGIHYFFRNHYTTVQYYNFYIYSGTQSSGHLFSSIAYGYLYFSAALAPVCTCFNIAISFAGERIISRIKRMDIYFILTLMFIRIVFSVFSNFPQSWNVVSRTIIIGMLIIGGSSLVTKIFKMRR